MALRASPLSLRPTHQDQRLLLPDVALPDKGVLPVPLVLRVDSVSEWQVATPSCNPVLVELEFPVRMAVVPVHHCVLH